MDIIMCWIIVLLFIGLIVCAVNTEEEYFDDVDKDEEE